MESRPDEYELAALHAALAEDEQTAELGLDLQVRGDTLYLTGSVGSEERKAAAGALAERHAGGLRVQNDLTVEHAEPPTDAEQLQ
jgi:osmotically-inducible protein OsmY